MIREPARAIIAAVDAASARWNDEAFPPRIAAGDAIAARTGHSAPAVSYALDRLFGSLRHDAIESVIADELGCLEALDGFVERPGRPRAHAAGAGRVLVVSSRTTIGVALVPAIFALCAKCDVLVKDREDYLVAAFFRTLAEALPTLRDSARAQTWSADAPPALNGFDVVVAFGDDATLDQIGASLRHPVRLIAYGAKASAGYVTREALSDESNARAIADGAALDLALYESEGCLSLHALFIEAGGSVSVERFSEMLLAAMRTAAGNFPPRDAEAGSDARIAGARDLAVFRGSTVYSSRQAAYLAVLDPPAEEPPLFLPRTIGIRRVEHPSQAAHYFERHGITLEALAVAQPRDDLFELAARLQASRVARFGTLQAPPLGGFHGGRPRIAEFVRWITDET